MKTIDEAAKEHAMHGITHKHDIDIFKAGVEFAQRWIPVEKEEIPVYEKIMLKDEDGGTMMGYYLRHKYTGLSFYSHSEPDIEFKLFGITHWRPIEYK